MSPHVDPITTEYQITPKHGMLKQRKFLCAGHGLADSLVSHEAPLNCWPKICRLIWRLNQERLCCQGHQKLLAGSLWAVGLRSLILHLFLSGSTPNVWGPLQHSILLNWSGKPRRQWREPASKINFQLFHNLIIEVLLFNVPMNSSISEAASTLISRTPTHLNL